MSRIVRTVRAAPATMSGEPRNRPARTVPPTRSPVATGPVSVNAAAFCDQPFAGLPVGWPVIDAIAQVESDA